MFHDKSVLSKMIRIVILHAVILDLSRYVQSKNPLNMTNEDESI